MQARHRFVRVALLLVVLLTGFAAGQLTAAQPQMKSALNHLRQAQRALAKASNDKGGHRAAAASLVDQAIEQVERGIAYDRRR